MTTLGASQPGPPSTNVSPAKIQRQTSSSRSAPPAVYHAASSTIPYGCEHTHLFARSGEKTWKVLSEQYSKIISLIFSDDNTRPILQTYRTKQLQQGGGSAADTATATRPSIKPTWLCLQCPHIWNLEGMKSHWKSPKNHSLFVESRNGYLFCANCDDFIYDPQLEAIRLAKGNRNSKRKFDDMTNSSQITNGDTVSHHHAYSAAEDQRMLSSSNIALNPCRAIGLRGLYNMGNTCFMSVVIQSLLHNPFLRAFYLSRGHKECMSDEEREKCTSCALDEIFTEFHSHEKTEGYGAVPMLIRSWKCSEQLAGYQQQDAHEYMQFILNSLHASNGGQDGGGSSSSTEDCPCIIHQTFYGKLRSTVTCDKCHNTTTALDPFMDLSLDLKAQARQKKKQIMASGEAEGGSGSKKDSKNNHEKDKGPSLKSIQLSLQDCLTSFTNEEKLAAADYFCGKCDENCDAMKQLRIKRLPPVMCIHLKRFSHTKDKSSKLETPVSFPLTLNMAPYTHLQPTTTATTLPTQPPAPTRKKGAPPPSTTTSPITDPNPDPFTLPAVAPINYLLSAVIVHKGDITSGHYVSYAREGKDWFLFDDSKVVLVGEGEVLNAEAYLLVYVVEEI